MLKQSKTERARRRVSAMLKQSKTEGARRRWRITGTCLACGSVGFVFYFISLVARRYIENPQVSLLLIFVQLCLRDLSMVVLLLGVLPSDVIAIRLVNAIVALCALAVAVLTARVAMTNSDTPSIVGFMSAVSLNAWVAVLRLCRAACLSPRERLDNIWRIFAHLLLGSAAIILGNRALLISFSLDPVYERWSSLGWIGWIEWVIVPTGWSFFFTVIGVAIGRPNFRMRAQAWLSSRGETKLMAAAVAAAIGNHPVEEAERKAGDLLRYITLDKISKAELAENKPNPELFKRSEAGRFGEVDAFLSHSWSDMSDEKWDAIQEWREHFKRKKGREPRVWLDKCCIDQLNIDASLMCLPVHLAACKKLLILAGGTYVTRMWCLLEIFVFLAAVNDMSRLECVALAYSEEAAMRVEKTFREFSITNCQCHGSDTRDRLLTIIEAGCGTLDEFDKIMRDLSIFAEAKAPDSPIQQSPTAAAEESPAAGTLEDTLRRSTTDILSLYMKV
jgi:hypothetical protein